MKHLTASLRRAYSLGIIVLFVASAFVIIGLTMHSPGAVLAQPTLQQQTTTYYWGTDSGVYWNRSGVDGQHSEYTVLSNYQNFYIGKIGQGSKAFTQTACANGEIWACPGQLGTQVTTTPNVPAVKYAYWLLWGPGTSSDCVSGAEQATLFWNTYQSTYQNTFGGNTLFVDVENVGGGCPLTTTNQAANRAMFNDFLRTLFNLTNGQKQVGVYTGGPFYGLMGVDYQFPPDIPIVLWRSKYPSLSKTQECKVQDTNGQVISINPLATDPTPGLNIYLNQQHIFSQDYQLGGVIPVVWQYCGDQGNLTFQNPTFGFIPKRIFTNTDVALIIDSSGSMITNDPQDKRKEASRIFVSDNAYKNDFVGIVDFDSFARVASPLQQLPDNKTSVIAAINTIDSAGGTDIGAGIQSGCDVLKLSSRLDYGKGAILLTDGDGSFSGQDQCFKAKGWPIFAFGFGSANDTLLQQIASNTGGTYTRITNLTSLTCEFIRVRSLIANIVPPPCSLSHVPQLASISISQTIAPGQAQATFSIGWPGSDVVMTLTSPSGRVIDRNTVAPDVTHENGATYEVYTLAHPEPGNWSVSLYGANVPANGEDVVFGFASIPANATPGILTLTSIADARVKEISPTVNYGTSSKLDADGSSGDVVQSYLRFNVSGLTGPVLRAVLRLHEASNGTANGPQLFSTSNAWEETTVTWNNRPAPLGSALGNAGVISVGTWIEYDVTALVTGNGSYNFVLIPDSSDGVEFSSRQGDALPELVLTLAQDSMPVPRPFNAVADARVKEISPTVNYGTATLLDVDGSSSSGQAEQSYLRFNVSDLPRPVQRAVLRLKSLTNGTVNGPQLFATSNTWEETTVTWNNRPAPVGSALGNTGVISPNTWIEYDVTALVTGNGTYNFALVADSNDAVEFSSRQGDAMPQLLITLVP